ncbi:hypothetical protein [Streptomyces sp. NPDC001657]|uniref:hypothetical protein n=1 Tax=Streptomyces sp. NPDC001657 TaxID=3154522 RepID=UPI003322C181
MAPESIVRVFDRSVFDRSVFDRSVFDIAPGDKSVPLAASYLHTWNLNVTDVPGNGV